MRILIACEYSAIVRDAFRAKGHDAWSCDILPTEGDPQWHLQLDVLGALDYGWDMMIAHPPCTYLSKAGAAYYNSAGRKEKREEAVEFFRKLWESPIDKIAIENPVPFKDLTSVVGRSRQTIHPYHFGEPTKKSICWWLKNLPPLIATDEIEPVPVKTYVRKSGKRKGELYHSYDHHHGKSQKERSRFFPGIAKAMAEQWGDK